jgi:hypothetical protein
VAQPAERAHPAPDVMLLADEGLLSPARHAEVDAHVADCEACRIWRTSLRDAEGAAAADLAGIAFNQREGTLPLGQARSRLENALSAARQREARPPRLAGAWWLRVPAALALVALLFAWPGPSNDWSGPDAETAAILPIGALTPGLATGISASELCSMRPKPDRVPGAMRGIVLASYGMTQVASDEYELDYLITPELGGARDPRNLWPERYASGPWNARVKDELETLLPDLVCRGQVDLRTAQQDIAANWIDAYKKYFGTTRPLRSYGISPDDLSFPPRQPDR